MDKSQLEAALNEVFRQSNVIHSTMAYERADGHYLHGEKTEGMPSDIYELGLRLTERNRHPGLLLTANRNTPIELSVEHPLIAAIDDVRDFAKITEQKGFLNIYYIPIRDPVGRLFVKCISSRQRKLREYEVRLIHSYCLSAMENLIVVMQPDAVDRPMLTPRERECLIAAAKGLTEKQTANLLSISPYTVHAHLENCKRKLGAPNKISAVIKGLNLDDLMPADVEIN